MHSRRRADRRRIHPGLGVGRRASRTGPSARGGAAQLLAKALQRLRFDHLSVDAEAGAHAPTGDSHLVHVLDRAASESAGLSLQIAGEQSGQVVARGVSGGSAGEARDAATRSRTSRILSDRNEAARSRGGSLFLRPDEASAPIQFRAQLARRQACPGLGGARDRVAQRAVRGCQLLAGAHRSRTDESRAGSARSTATVRTIEDSAESFNDCLIPIMSMLRSESRLRDAVSTQRVYRLTRPQRPLHRFAPARGSGHASGRLPPGHVPQLLDRPAHGHAAVAAVARRRGLAIAVPADDLRSADAGPGAVASAALEATRAGRCEPHRGGRAAPGGLGLGCHLRQPPALSRPEQPGRQLHGGPLEHRYLRTAGLRAVLRARGGARRARGQLWRLPSAP